ncbi:cytochrome P450 [Streptomyces sp. NBC_00513]|uniref:cytochrome P450 n=1 Tax=unclassified Streptomyces TaxID=2593676 RepID=UPI00224C8ACE|nr:cytochrome P450 [Streptomyces sp. NBC_00424]MCX5071088.1 cytochrome P450 [Streptomyces sp. NBC_00424]WUD45488.1 cytochrome P450 [Streptomyces sp. NBC_00513]
MTCPVTGAGGPSAPAYPFSDLHTLDLEPEYAQLHQQGGGLHRATMPYGGQAWLAIRYEDVRQILADPRFSRSAANTGQAPRLSSEVLPSSSMMAMDAPEHTRIRRILAKHFTVPRIEALRGRATTLVDQLIDNMTGSKPADLLTGLALPFPLLMVCELLGVPAEGRDTFADFSAALRSRTMSQRHREAARNQFEEWTARHLLFARGAEAGGSLLHELLEPDAVGRSPLDVREAVDVAIALLVGGVGSPSTLLASGICTLLRRPDVVRAIVADEALIPAAVEELMRLVPVGVGGGFVRVATEDLTLSGTLVRRGEAVVPAMPAANRDPSVFPDPDDFKLDRPTTPRHLGLGHGTHHCIGAHLARVELQTAIGRLFSRLPGLRLAVPEDQLRWHRGLVVRELKELPVTW